MTKQNWKLQPAFMRLSQKHCDSVSIILRFLKNCLKKFRKSFWHNNFKSPYYKKCKITHFWNHCICFYASWSLYEYQCTDPKLSLRIIEKCHCYVPPLPPHNYLLNIGVIRVAFFFDKIIFREAELDWK